MADPYDHARSSARKYGGVPEDYLAVHKFFDQTKALTVRPTHRLLLHNAWGIELAIQVFGQTFRRQSDGGVVRTRWIGEMHVCEDFGFVPTSAQTIEAMMEAVPLETWMVRGARKLSQELEDTHDDQGA